MTEAEWLICTDARKMLEWITAKHGPYGPNLDPESESAQILSRKLRLLSLAWWWHSCHMPCTTEQYHEHRRWAESWIDRGCPAADVQALPRGGRKKNVGLTRGWLILQYGPEAAARSYLRPHLAAEQAAILRCMFNFRPGIEGRASEACLAPPLHSTPVRTLAQAIYDEHRFQDLPILADALDEAGCTNADLLSHLRGPGPHVRGCWALDLLLGKI
jgi:hypothetical protein